MSGAGALRAATAAAHDRVDARFGDYNLGDRDDYARFLIDHARAVAGAEAYLDRASPTLAWQPRLPMLRADLAALGLAMPPPTPLDLPTDAATADGVVYVLEGSRLGGQMLMRGVGAGLPAAYLGAVHAPGAWRALRRAMDAAAERDDDWIARAQVGAAACFALY